ncbi:MAG: hypothetical protein ACTHJN_10375 [Ginsengibacter sp.]
MNAFISDQYNNEIPRVNKRTQPANIFYTPPIHSDADISVTTAHTRILPLKFIGLLMTGKRVR